VHRDIKLENAVIDSKFHLKLIDLGLSAEFEEDHKLTSFCGSAIYCSPEMLKRLPHGTPNDVWSLGVVLFSLVTALIPWNAATESEQIALAIRGEYSFPPHMLPSLSCQELLERIFVIDPKKRITINEILAHPWMELSSCSFSIRRTKSLSRFFNFKTATWRGRLSHHKPSNKLFGVIDPTPILPSTHAPTQIF